MMSPSEKNTDSPAILSKELIADLIVIVRGQRMMLDRDLANLYGVTTKAFNQAVKRNQTRFPNDFLIQLNKEELNQLVTNCDRFKNLKHTNYLPYAFTEHGAIMAAMILNSPRATAMSVYVIRAFTKLRELFGLHKKLIKQMSLLEERVSNHDGSIQEIIEVVR